MPGRMTIQIEFHMATFEQRQSGRWQAKIRREGRPKLSRTFLTKEEALSWANFVEERMVLNIFNRGDEKFVTPTQQSKIKAINKSKAQSNKIKKYKLSKFLNSILSWKNRIMN